MVFSELRIRFTTTRPHETDEQCDQLIEELNDAVDPMEDTIRAILKAKLPEGWHFDISR